MFRIKYEETFFLKQCVLGILLSRPSSVPCLAVLATRIQVRLPLSPPSVHKRGGGGGVVRFAETLQQHSRNSNVAATLSEQSSPVHTRDGEDIDKRKPRSSTAIYKIRVRVCLLLSLCASSRMWVRHLSVVIVPPEGGLEFSAGLTKKIVFYPCHG